MVGRYVGRPGLYGNPWLLRRFQPVGPGPDPAFCDAIRSGTLKRWTVEGPGVTHGQMLFADARFGTQYVVNRFASALAHGELPYRLDDVRRELVGLDLACYCPLVGPDGQPWPCHADVLLRAANSPLGTLLPAA